MAVTGNFGNESIVLNNAAEEATLRDILDVLSTSTSGGRIFDSTAARQLSSSTRQASGGLLGMLGAAYRTEDGLDRLSRSQREARGALNSFTTSLYSNASSLIRGFASGDLSQATQGAFDTISNTLKGGIDAIQKATKSPVADVLGEAAKGAISATVGTLGYVESTVREFSTQFDQLANVGFIAGEGINEFRNNLNRSGVTVQEFDKLIKNGGDNLRIFGGSTSQGARQVMRIRSAMIGQEEQFKRLGYNFDEIALLVAEYGASLEKGAGTRIHSDQDIINGTIKYAANLRLLTDLTGKSAQQFKAESDAASRMARVQAGLMELGPAATETFGDLFVMMKEKFPGYEELLADYFSDLHVAQSDLTARLESTNPAMAAVQQEIYRGVKEGTITQQNAADEVARIIQSRADDIRYYQQQEALFAGRSIEGFEGVGTSIRSLDDIMKLDRAAMAQNLADALKNRDAATTAVAAVNDAQMAFAKGMESIKTTLVDTMGVTLVESVKWAAEKLRDFGDYISDNFTTLGKFSEFNKAIVNAPVTAGQTIESTSTGIATGGGALAPGMPGYEQQQLFKSLSKLTDEELAERGFKKIGGSGMVPLSFQKMARGGIIPNVGPEGMPIRAGDGVAEAVVPLPDGRSIPVTMRDNQAFKDMSSKLDLMTSINRAMLDAMEENNRLVKLGNNLIS